MLEVVAKAAPVDRQVRVAETMRRLVRAILEHQREQFQDDATALCLRWRGSGRQPGP